MKQMLHGLLVMIMSFFCLTLGAQEWTPWLSCEQHPSHDVLWQSMSLRHRCFYDNESRLYVFTYQFKNDNPHDVLVSYHLFSSSPHDVFKKNEQSELVKANAIGGYTSRWSTCVYTSELPLCGTVSIVISGLSTVGEKKLGKHHKEVTFKSLDYAPSSGDTVTITTDIACVVMVDNDQKREIGDGTSVQLIMNGGEHMLVSTTIDGSLRWDTTINVLKGKKNVVNLRLRSHLQRFASVILVADKTCVVAIDDTMRVNVTAGQSQRIMMPLGVHNVVATTVGHMPELRCENRVELTDEAQRVVKLSFNTQLQQESSLLGHVTDPRDGKTYETIRMGSQTWMAENLNYNTGCNWCYGDISSNCERYGRLYDWQTALVACPSGWHLPSESEFEMLLNAAGGKGEAAYLTLTQATGWSVLLGGWRGDDGTYISNGVDDYWWSSTAFGSSNARCVYISSFLRDAGSYVSFQGFGFSVRCVKD